VNKSIWTALFTPIMQLFIALIFGFVFFTVKNSRRQIDLQNKEESERRLKIFRKTWGYFTIFGGALLMLMFFLMQLSIYNVIPIFVATAGLIIFLVVI
jgi:uncharacterized membrane protein